MLDMTLQEKIEALCKIYEGKELTWADLERCVPELIRQLEEKEDYEALASLKNEGFGPIYIKQYIPKKRNYFDDIDLDFFES